MSTYDYWSAIDTHTHTNYRLRDALDKLAPRSNIKMKLAEDGSSIGAAFAAAMNYDGSPPSLTPR